MIDTLRVIFFSVNGMNEEYRRRMIIEWHERENRCRVMWVYAIQGGVPYRNYNSRFIEARGVSPPIKTKRTSLS